MKNLLDISAMLKLKEKGFSNRSIAKTLGINRKTVNKYWNEYKENLQNHFYNISHSSNINNP